MKVVLCILIGYVIGALNPAALISKMKHKSLRDKGTGNLGATNTMLVFGKKFGIPVMLFDIFKGFLVVKLTAWIVPEIQWLSMATGLAAVIGHCFPFYMKFKGGKGLAAFAGMVLAYEVRLFAFLLITGILLMILVNYSFILPYYAAVVFPIFVAVTSRSLPHVLLGSGAAILIMIMHFGNILKAKRGQDNKIRPFIKNKLMPKR